MSQCFGVCCIYPNPNQPFSNSKRLEDFLLPLSSPAVSTGCQRSSCTLWPPRKPVWCFAMIISTNKLLFFLACTPCRSCLDFPLLAPLALPPTCLPLPASLPCCLPPRRNGQKVAVALEELGLPYEAHTIDIRKRACTHSAHSASALATAMRMLAALLLGTAGAACALALQTPSAASRGCALTPHTAQLMQSCVLGYCLACRGPIQ